MYSLTVQLSYINHRSERSIERKIYFIDKGYYWSIGLNSNYNTFEENVNLDFIRTIDMTDSDINSLNFQYAELTNQIYAQSFLKRTFLIGAGIEHKWKKYLSK